jgi:hypothetical protein
MWKRTVPNRGAAGRDHDATHHTGRVNRFVVVFQHVASGDHDRRIEIAVDADDAVDEKPLAGGKEH